MLENQNYMITQALFKRFFIVILILFTGVVASLMYYIPSAVRIFSEEVAIDHATRTLKQYSILRKYYTDSVIQKLIQSKDIQISLDQMSISNGIPIPAKMIQDLNEQYRALGMKLKLYSPLKFKQSKKSELSQDEIKIWDWLNAHPDGIYFDSMHQDNSNVVTVAIADKMTSENCVTCHNNHPLTPRSDWELGDIRGVLQMDVDISLQIKEGHILTMTILGVLVVLLLCILVFIYILLAKEKLELQLYFNATHDQLTGLNNRLIFFDRLDLSLKQIKRTQSRAALFYIDLDGFKKVNDDWGHDAGDFVLKEVAQRLQRVARESDTVVRLGGDEFAILFTNIEDSNFIHDMAARINSSIGKPISHQTRTYTLGCSIGVAVAPDHTENASELLKRSDKAMYQAKKEGKNSYRIYSNYN